jgi:hypothetical protein
MELNPSLKSAICALFEVVEDQQGVQRVITPLEYAGTQDKVVVRVRPRNGYYQIDENGESAFYANMHGGDTDSETINRWAEELSQHSGKTGLTFNEDETITAQVTDPQLVAPTIFHVAAASQQLYALATAHKERSSSDFKARLAAVVNEVCTKLHVPVIHDAVLPIGGGDWMADHLIGDLTNEIHPPLIVIAATSATRLLEAEVIHMEYRLRKRRGFVLAVAENSKIVGVKQFNRANYHTGKTVEFSEYDLGQLMVDQLG